MLMMTMMKGTALKSLKLCTQKMISMINTLARGINYIRIKRSLQ